jgi:hypothetical protein
MYAMVTTWYISQYLTDEFFLNTGMSLMCLQVDQLSLLLDLIQMVQMLLSGIHCLHLARVKLLLCVMKVFHLV